MSEIRRYAHVWFCPTDDRALDAAEVDYYEKEEISRHLRGTKPCRQPVWSVAIPTDVVRGFYAFNKKRDYSLKEDRNVGLQS